ncbi:DMT family transporter [Paenibacillus methanolicus]|uniref:Drug/metabolite transporter (DMT)-like permease n=1 Tax=Paenibacillus methanolicus TaxID=582686 RepID=A0A5S5C3N6_9BACL|nr:DMT family transporter [Paenibacillus methanolicus]TYP73749.1 drug/metabolite transporter (DMT)-like permease [Paenibacillus methanolicus]
MITAERFYRHPLGILAASGLATLLWGSSYPFIKWSYSSLDIGRTDTFEQLLFAGYRFTLAGLLILLFMLARRERLAYQPGSLRILAPIALFQTVLQYICFYAGMALSSGVIGAVIAGTISFFQIALAHFVYRDDRLNGTKAAGLLIGFSGLAVLGFSNAAHTGGPIFSVGEILLMASSFFSAAANLISRRGASAYSVTYLNGYQMLLGGVALMLISGWKSGFAPFAFDGKSSLMLLHLALVSAVAFMLWNNVMKYNAVGSVSMYLFLIPVFGVLQSALLLGEQLHLSVLAALLLVSLGIVVVNRKKSSAAFKQTSESTGLAK